MCASGERFWFAARYRMGGRRSEYIYFVFNDFRVFEKPNRSALYATAHAILRGVKHVVKSKSITFFLT